MTPDRPKVLASYEAAGFKLDLKRFESRVIAQKLAYLFQAAGVKLGYNDFNFHLRGTYSPNLAKDLFKANPNPHPGARGTLTKREEETVKKIASTMKNEAMVLEAAAAYHYLRHHEGLDQSRAEAEIRKTKPFLSIRDLVVGINRCKQAFPEHTEEDLESLRKEMEPWDAASAASTTD